MLELEFHIKPEGKGRPRFTRKGFAYTPDKTRIFEDSVKKIAMTQMKDRKIFLGPVNITIAFCFKKPKTTKNKCMVVRPDIDNLQKGIFDALNGVCWKDDSQIVEVLAQKVYVDSEPRILLRATEDETINADIPTLRRNLVWRGRTDL